MNGNLIMHLPISETYNKQPEKISTHGRSWQSLQAEQTPVSLVSLASLWSALSAGSLETGRSLLATLASGTLNSLDAGLSSLTALASGSCRSDRARRALWSVTACQLRDRRRQRTTEVQSQMYC